MTRDDVRAAYTARAQEYAEIFGSIDAAHPDDRQLVGDWARSLSGPIIDAGCGPGHWTKFLSDSGVAVEGVDLVPAFVEHAQERFPEERFGVGTLDDLGCARGSLAGILAWYSIIHVPPADVPAALAEFARCLAPGGGLLLGFFDGVVVEPFPHKVVTAYFWPVAELSRQLAAAGFETVETYTRVDPAHRPHAAIVARRARSMAHERVKR